MAHSYQTLFISVISGGLLAIAQLVPPLAFLNFFGLVPLIYICIAIADQNIEKKEKLRKLFWHGWLVGLIYFGTTFFWIWSTYPLDAFGISSKFYSLLIIGFLWMWAIVLMAIFWGLFTLMFSFLKAKGTLWRVLSMASAFALIEYLRAYGFSIIFLGSGTLFGPYFTYGNLAYNFAGSSLIRLSASIIGIYGITFGIAFVNGLFYILFFKKRKPVLFIALATLVLCLTLQFKIPAKGGRNIDFALIQTNESSKPQYSQKDRIESLIIQQELLNEVAETQPDTRIIVMPETSSFFQDLAMVVPSDKAENYLANLFSHSAVIISSNQHIDRSSGAFYSRQYSYDTKRGVVDSYDKRLLAPIGEFLPHWLEFLIGILNKTSKEPYAMPIQYENGKKSVSTFLFDDRFKIAPLICSEILSPAFVRKATKNAEIIVAQVSNGMFRGSDQIIRQHIAQAQFRAVENATPVLVAANAGLSYAIDSNGDILKITPDQSPQILTGSVGIRKSRSWYNYIGDLPIIFGSFLIIAYHYFHKNLKS